MKCKHKPTGYVTNQPDDHDQNRALASVATCELPECISESQRWVAGETNETATYVRWPAR